MPTGVYIRTEEYRAKQRATHLKIGSKPPRHTTEQLKEWSKKLGLKPPSRLGFKASEETRTKMRNSAKHGSLNVNWKGGISNTNKLVRKSYRFKEWRKAVFERDDYTCQKYKVRGVSLHPHHVLNFSEYPELRFDVNNGVTLSEKAHREFHSKYGRINNTREQIVEFLSGQ